MAKDSISNWSSITDNTPTPGAVDLKAILFSAKFDYVTLDVPADAMLPKLQGRIRRPKEHHGKRVTIHDATPKDLATLRARLGDLPVREIEVAVDVRPRPSARATDADSLLGSVVVNLFAAALDPLPRTEINKRFRVFYRRLGQSGNVAPFNQRLPLPTDQQLHGGRDDACQVKVYFKRTDMGAPLHKRQARARVEVRLERRALMLRGVGDLKDLMDFKFRKQLMPFFTHVRGTERLDASSTLAGPLGELMLAKRQQMDEQLWQRNGVGSFTTGGEVTQGVRLLRHSAVNDRIGQALYRLEESVCAAKSVCLDE